MTPVQPKTICHCNNITDKEITETIKQTGLTTIPQIKQHLRTHPTSNCKELNPTGQCCHPTFNHIIQQTQKAKNNFPHPTANPKHTKNNT